MPRNEDAAREYCGACQFVDTERCTFCLQSKLSNVHRLPLGRLASLLMNEGPSSTLEVCRELGAYARFDERALRTNARLGFDASRRAMCEAHRSETEVRNLVKAREGAALAACRAKLDRALRAARDGAARHALELAAATAARISATTALAEARALPAGGPCGPGCRRRAQVRAGAAPPEASPRGAPSTTAAATQCPGWDDDFGDLHAEAVAAALAAHAAATAAGKVSVRDAAVQCAVAGDAMPKWRWTS